MLRICISIAACSLLLGCGGTSEDREFLTQDSESDIFAAGPSGGGSASNQSDLNDGGNEEPSGSDSSISSSLINDFLWKPVSESDGNLVVLVNPIGVRVEVTGAISETLADRGPSNGRGTTARARSPGCRFGDRVVVEFFDRSGRRILLEDGRRSVTVPRGCDRYEFKL
ncbi:MAG: hypothetical protein QY326_07505 [Bdellovibrionota bacterium]|nr:MAG: hypothetical protein QY326_07505 [Bdellovibrionota bacterium]